MAWRKTYLRMGRGRKNPTMRRKLRRVTNYILGAGTALEILPSHKARLVRVVGVNRKAVGKTGLRRLKSVRRWRRTALKGTIVFGTDTDALASDWLAVGGDLMTAFDSVKSEAAQR